MKKLKIFLSVILVVSLMIPINFTINGAENTYTYDDFVYEIVKDEDGTKVVNIKDYTGNDENLVIPEMIDNNKVVSVSFANKNNTKFKSIKISKYIKNYDEFNLDLSSLESYSVAPENVNFSSEDGVLFNKDKTTLLIYPKGKQDEEYIEPSSVITSTGLNKNPYLKKLTFSSNKEYKKIADYGYINSNLEEIVIPENVEVIGEFSFQFSEKLNIINYSNGLKYIWDYAFQGCVSLTEQIFPDTLLGIGNSAFNNCIELKKVKFPNGLKNISAFAFSDNLKLKSVKIPDSVVKIGSNAFAKPKGHTKTKINMKSYMKIKCNNVGRPSGYLAKATVTTKGKTKDYKAVNITKIKGEKKNITLNKGKSKKLKTTVYVNNKKKGILKTNILIFTSSNKKVVKVANNGKIKALKKGKATITIKLRTSNKSYKVKVRVK